MFLFVSTEEDGGRMPAVGRMSCRIGLRPYSLMELWAAAFLLMLMQWKWEPAAFTGRR